EGRDYDEIENEDSPDSAQRSGSLLRESAELAEIVAGKADEEEDLGQLDSAGAPFRRPRRKKRSDDGCGTVEVLLRLPEEPGRRSIAKREPGEDRQSEDWGRAGQHPAPEPPPRERITYTRDEKRGHRHRHRRLDEERYAERPDRRSARPPQPESDGQDRRKERNRVVVPIADELDEHQGIPGKCAARHDSPTRSERRCGPGHGWNREEIRGAAQRLEREKGSADIAAARRAGETRQPWPERAVRQRVVSPGRVGEKRVVGRLQRRYDEGILVVHAPDPVG